MRDARGRRSEAHAAAVGLAPRRAEVFRHGKDPLIFVKSPRSSLRGEGSPKRKTVHPAASCGGSHTKERTCAVIGKPSQGVGQAQPFAPVYF
jgi:hypothetical protein